MRLLLSSVAIIFFLACNPMGSSNVISPDHNINNSNEDQNSFVGSFLTHFGVNTTSFSGNNSSLESCRGVSVDSIGNVYCAGLTNGNMGETNGGSNDAFVLKLDKDGNLIWVTQLGATTNAPGGNNSGNDICNGVAVDNSGNVYCAGYTSGSIGETNGGGGSDAFVLKLNDSGEILWLTQLGASTVASGGSNVGADFCNSVSVDSLGNVYCAGYTTGPMGETNGGSRDAFVLKLDKDGNLIWATQLGATTNAPGGNSSGIDVCNGVAVDNSGNVYCAGYTSGSIGEANGGGEDAFILKLDTSGNILWLTQFGSNTKAIGGANTGNEGCWDLAVDSFGNVYCVGATDGSIGETSGGSTDAFVVKIDAIGNLLWMTQLGGTTTAASGSNSGADSCKGVSVDLEGNVYCSGTTSGNMGELNGGFSDAFVMKLNSSGSLLWLTQLGSVTFVPGGNNTGTDICEGVAVDSYGNVYCAGYTSGPIGETYGGGTNDAFVMKLESDGNFNP